MSVKLVDSALPKSRAGRKAAEIDPEIVAAFVAAFQDSSTVEVEGETRPRALGIPDPFDTKGKASSLGRRYAVAVGNALKVTVRVSVYSAEQDKGPFYWRIYVPLSAEVTASEVAS